MYLFFSFEHLKPESELSISVMSIRLRVQQTSQLMLKLILIEVEEKEKFRHISILQIFMFFNIFFGMKFTSNHNFTCEINNT